eukprot:171435-Amorphochlora_amoeboformis.AAC.1
MNPRGSRNAMSCPTGVPTSDLSHTHTDARTLEMRMLDIPVALLILCALLSSGAKGNCLGGECDVDDTYREPDPEAQSSESQQMMLHVVNGEEDKIGVYWVGSGEKVRINEL